MKKEYIFLAQIIIIFYLLFLIIDYKYKEYLTNNHIEKTINANNLKKKEIENNKEKLEYINTNAFKNKILKEEQYLKSKSEVIINITNEDTYDKFSKEEPKNINSVVIESHDFQESMSIFQKWIYFLFKIDLR